MFGAATMLYTLLTGNTPDKMGRAAFRWPPQGEASLSSEEIPEWKRLHGIIRRAVHENREDRFFDFHAFSEKLARKESPVEEEASSKNSPVA